MRWTAALIILVAVALYGMATGYGLLFRLAYVLGGVLLVSWVWSRFSLRGVEVELAQATRETEVGGWAEERLRVRNTSPLPKTWVEVQDQTDLPGHRGGKVVGLPQRDFRAWKLRTQCLQRGKFTLGPFTVASGDPFGLFRYSRTLGPRHPLLVYPKTVPLPHFELPPGELAGEARLRRRAPQVTPNAVTVREYIQGDSFNRVHWLTTARMGQLMVKEFELDPASNVWIVLDLQQDVHAGDPPENTEEYAVTLAASLARKYLDLNRGVGFIAYGAEAHVLKPERGAGQLQQVLQALAEAKAQGTLPLSTVLTQEGQSFGMHSAIIVITASTYSDWGRLLGGLARRGVRTAAVLLDVSSFGRRDIAVPAITAQLLGAGVVTYVVRQGDKLSDSLQPAGFSGTAPTSPEPVEARA
ncbi:MAG: DUF58 domain-containing protein [Chloroflexi bacterium]|nr:DUF58 domain-containing protein [Chloroflexota bacterium]